MAMSGCGNSTAGYAATVTGSGVGIAVGKSAGVAAGLSKSDRSKGSLVWSVAEIILVVAAPGAALALSERNWAARVAKSSSEIT